MVPTEGVEPTHPFGYQILSLDFWLYFTSEAVFFGYFMVYFHAMICSIMRM